MITLDEAKADLMSAISDGATCPCCGQYAKVYRRSIYGTLATQLWQMVYEERPLHPRELVSGNNLSGGGDHPKLRHWGLAQACHEEPWEGHWTATMLGREFVHGRVSVPKYIYLYNNRVLEKSDEAVRIDDCYKERFDFDSIMKKYPLDISV